VTGLSLALRAFWRDVRAGRLTVLMAALAIAVAAECTVGFFTSRLARAMEQQSGELLAADLRLESGRPLDPDGRYGAEARRRGLVVGRTLGFTSMVYSRGQGQLAALRGVTDAYPLRGRIRIANEAFGTAVDARGIPSGGEAWVDGRLLSTLGLRVGDSIDIGVARLRIAAVLDYRPDQGSGFADLSPTVLVSYGDLEATGLIQPGSRATWAELYAGDPDRVAAFAAWLKAAKDGGSRLVEAGEASAQLGTALSRSQRFLSLASLATIVLAAISIAITARRYATRHLDSAALLRCLGLSRRRVLLLGALELGCAALAGSAVGVLLGYGAQALLARLVGELLAGPLPPPTLMPALLALATTALMMFGFALAPLLELRDTPPARVLSRNLEPPRLRYGVPYVLALGALVAILFLLVGDAKLVAYAAAGLVVAGLAFFAAGLGLVRVASAARGSAGVAWRYGLANLARRRLASAMQIVAFGLGLTVLLLLLVVRRDLLGEWHRSLPATAPNHFLINIQPTEVDGVVAFLTAHGVPRPDLYPWVRARLTDVNGTPVERLQLAGDRARNFAEREQNLSWSPTLPADNRLVSGSWWAAEPSTEPEVSVASEYSEDLGVRPGDRMGFDVAGERVVATVANVRKVRWDSFRPNFFLLFRPGVLDAAAGTYMTSVYLTQAQRPALADFIRQYPTISVFDVGAILTQVRRVVDRAALGVESVSLFTILAGIVVLLAMVEASQDERRRESATLRTLGARRALVIGSVAVEFMSGGALAGLLAAAAAEVAHYSLSVRLFGLPYSADPWVWLIGPVAGAVLVGGAGMLAARRVVDSPPALVLRDG
jgi:putative ABC transport system permease protein